METLLCHGAAGPPPGSRTDMRQAVDSCLGAAPTLAPGSVPLLTQPGHSHQSSPVSYFSSSLLAVKGRDHSSQQVCVCGGEYQTDRQTSGT